jgi:hypothetical protein
MQTEDGLLLGALHRHEAHARPADRFTYRLGVECLDAVLTALVDGAGARIGVPLCA